MGIPPFVDGLILKHKFNLLQKVMNKSLKARKRNVNALLYKFQNYKT